MANNFHPSSSSDSRYSYDVFLSFRGEDTRNTFTDHLYTALVQSGLRTFRDEEEIRNGENIRSELVSAIQRSRGSIIVFSRTYAFSRWCLEELSMIMALNKNSGSSSSSSKFVILPVFYDVDPTNIRRQSGIVGEAFAKYEERIKGEKDEVKVKELTEKVSRWREALTDAANLSGMVFQHQSSRKESEFIQKVVKVITDNISRPVFHIHPHLVGIQERAKCINKWLEDVSTDVCVFGISGMGGIGKTTIAKYVYNQHCGRFEGSSFLANVRESSKQPNGLASLQSQLLSDVTKGKKEEINDVDEGKLKLKYVVSCKRILLVLDDVDHQDQMNAILGIRDWFYPGSRIIITTRRAGLLKLPEVDKVYNVAKLTYDEAIGLMRYHTFGKKPPNEEFKNHIEKAVRLCEGLPLALKVVGSSLCGQTVGYWVSALEKLEMIPNRDILEKLKISYDSLQDDHDKNLFLHIACFFLGQEKNCVITILDECEFYTTVGIQNLIDRSLVTDFGGELMVHQLLQDMGREIIRQESPRYLGERSRLWCHKESFDVLKTKTGTKTIEGLVLNMQMVKIDRPVLTESRDFHSKRSDYKEFMSHQDNPQKRRRVSLISWLAGKMSSSDSEHPDLETDAFEKMENLKFLQLYYAKLTGSYGSFPQKLRLLCWHGFPLKAIPINLSLDGVVSLDMQHSSLRKVWQGIRFLGSLKILNLSYSKQLLQTPNFSGIPKLERLMLRGCISLSEVCESIEVLQGLIILDMEDCINLRKLPTSMSKLSCLQTLNLAGCPNAMASLGVLLTNGRIPANSLGTTFAYKSWIAFPWIWSLKRRSLADTSTTLLSSCLRELNLSGCNLSDESFPLDFSSLSLLRVLDLSNNPLRNLPECVRTLGIYWLTIRACRQLQSLHGLPGSLFLRIDYNPSLEIVTSSGGVNALSILSFKGCPKLAKYFQLEHITEVDRQNINNLSFQDVALMGNIELDIYGFPIMRGLDFFANKSLRGEKRPIKGLHEFGIFSTFVKGFAVPSWYTESKVMGPSISFMVPPTNVRIQCLTLCCLYQFDEDVVDNFRRPWLMKINNKTKDLTWIFRPNYLVMFRSPDDENRAWLSQWKLRDELCGGDQVTVTFAMGNNLKVTECGYDLVFDEETKTAEEEGMGSYPAEEE